MSTSHYVNLSKKEYFPLNHQILFSFLKTIFISVTLAVPLGFFKSRMTAIHHMEQSMEILSTPERYQGLIFDSPGRLSLLLSLVEKSGEVFITDVNYSYYGASDIHRSFVAPKHFLTWNHQGFTYALENSSMKISGTFALPWILLFQNTLSFCGLIFSVLTLIFLYLRFQKNRMLHEFDRKRFELAQQVAHDIRSPLTALDVITTQMIQQNDPVHRVLKQATQRIQEIAEDLLKGVPRSEEEQPQKLLLKEALQSILVEKKLFLSRTQKNNHQSIQTIIEFYSLSEAELNNAFIEVHPKEFRRVLSNLINNAIESIEAHEPHQNDLSLIKVSIQYNEISWIIEIQDRGPGIPSDIMAHLGKRGYSYNKPHGTGLGLFHAHQWMTAWKGEVKIDSDPHQGTSVKLLFPKAWPPAGFLNKLNLNLIQKIYIIDDDPSIYELWIHRLRPLGFSSNNIRYFAKLSDLRNYFQDHAYAGELLLMDYEFPERLETGLDFLEELSGPINATLVSSRFEEPLIQNRCKKLGISWIPKSRIGTIDLIYNLFEASGHNESLLLVQPEAKPQLQFQALLIDDDPLIHQVWSLSAKKKGLSIMVLSLWEQFLEIAPQINVSTPIYVDQELGSHLEKGETLIKKIVDMGFPHVYLCTGHAQETIQARLPDTISIRDKTPPWLN